MTLTYLKRLYHYAQDHGFMEALIFDAKTTALDLDVRLNLSSQPLPDFRTRFNDAVRERERINPKLASIIHSLDDPSSLDDLNIDARCQGSNEVYSPHTK